MTGSLHSEQPERRRSPRFSVGWVGEYVIPTRLELGWNDCLVVDVSETGVGLMLFGWPDGIASEVEVLVRFEPRPDADPLELLGAVRNSTQVRIGELRVGVELNRSAGGALVALLGSFMPSSR